MNTYNLISALIGLVSSFIALGCGYMLTDWVLDKLFP